MNILLALAHAIEEHDQVKLLTELGHDVFSVGAYIDPRNPLDDIRPALPEVPFHPELKAIVDAVPATAERPDRLWNAKANWPDELLDWADVTIVHHIEYQWIWPQWEKLKGHRVIWRTVGQSSYPNELMAKQHREKGAEVEIVRYSPLERVIPNYAGEDALIRFWKDPDEWTGWTGQDDHILIVVQDPMTRGGPYTTEVIRDLEKQGQNTEEMANRLIGMGQGGWINLQWIMEATRGLPVKWVGRGSEWLGGTGKISTEALQEEMRRARCVLYTGTQPASYTLFLIEAMMTGTPVVSIAPHHMKLFAYSPRLYEGHAIAPLYADQPLEAREMLAELMDRPLYAQKVSEVSRQRAILLFGKDRIKKAWQGWLDDRTLPDPEPDELPDVSE